MDHVSPEARDYDYELPEERIRLVPPPRREESRLAVVPRSPSLSRPPFLSSSVSHLPSLLAPGDLLVANDSRVVPARTLARTSRGRAIEILVLGPFDQGTTGTVRFLGKGLKGENRLHLFDGRGILDGIHYDELLECFVAIYRGEVSLGDFLEVQGEMPLPPYIARRRRADRSDRERYQTVYSRVPGSVAAPTAGLHLGVELLDRLREKGIERASVTLHVGVGTFRGLSEGPVERHRMHEEWYDVPRETAEAIVRTKARGGRVVAVGTTSLRALESAYGQGEIPEGGRSGWTRLYVRPGYRFLAIDALLTNFHTPRSTLLVLVDAFLGGDGRWREIYRRALEEGFFFLSYGDAMLIL
ncbi:MAG: tRNA preQ1(34) S-adenosylmethionine ribosyltransferase-isomerase QueA [Leptospirillia bacterium]